MTTSNASDPSPPIAIGVVHTKPRERAFLLDWPVEHGGKHYDKIVVRRMTVAEVASVTDMMETRSVKYSQFPMYFHEDGERAPIEVIDNLDDDDMLSLVEGVADFLPRRFAMRAAEGDDTSQSSGENIEAMSGA